METDPLEILSLYQHDGTRHSSVLSFQSVQTTERLLDKLELDADDERLLEAAVQEELTQEDMKSEKGIEGTEKTNKYGVGNVDEKERRNGLSICLPASGFPSLKNRCFTPKEVLRVSLIDPLGEGLCTTGEQHVPSGPRCSYFVEEIDSEDNNSSTTTNVCSSRNSIMARSIDIDASTTYRSDNSDDSQNLILSSRSTPMRSTPKKNTFRWRNLFRSRKSLRRKDSVNTVTGISKIINTPTSKKPPETSNGLVFPITSSLLLDAVPSSSSE